MSKRGDKNRRHKRNVAAFEEGYPKCPRYKSTRWTNWPEARRYCLNCGNIY